MGTCSLDIGQGTPPSPTIDAYRAPFKVIEAQVIDFADLKILKLHDLFQLKLLSFVYDCVNRTSPSCFHSSFDLVESVHLYGTRQVTKNDIFVTQKNTLQYGIRSVRYCGAKCWNDIPVNIKRSPSANIFRQKLKAFLFQNHCKSCL